MSWAIFFLSSSEFALFTNSFKVAFTKIAHKFSDNAVDTKPTPFATGEKRSSPSQSLRRSRNLSSPNFQDIHTAHLKSTTTVTNTAAPTTTETTIATDRNNPIEVKRKSLLNASYSSEEILLQAASSLQGLEGMVQYLSEGFLKMFKNVYT